jgi:hypothetical protein
LSAIARHGEVALHGATGHAGLGALQQFPWDADVQTISSVSSQLPGG